MTSTRHLEEILSVLFAKQNIKGRNYIKSEKEKMHKKGNRKRSFDL